MNKMRESVRQPQQLHNQHYEVTKQALCSIVLFLCSLAQPTDRPPARLHAHHSTLVYLFQQRKKNPLRQWAA